MKNSKLIFFLFMLAIPSSYAQLKSHSFEEVERLSIEKPKPIVIFIHTSWCKYCKIMENTTFKNQEVASVLNEKFYFVLLDAGTKNDITFNKYTFQFKPTGPNTGIHELAASIATIDGQLTYPTITILDSSYSILFQKQSYLKAKDLISILEKIN